MQGVSLAATQGLTLSPAVGVEAAVLRWRIGLDGDRILADGAGFSTTTTTTTTITTATTTTALRMEQSAAVGAVASVERWLLENARQMPPLPLRLECGRQGSQPLAVSVLAVVDGGVPAPLLTVELHEQLAQAAKYRGGVLFAVRPGGTD